MGKETTRIRLGQLAAMIVSAWGNLAFTMLEIGAAPHEGGDEQIPLILEAFPGTRVIAFELDERLCDELNSTARPGMRYYSVPLGRAREERLLFETEHPMCTSLYRPNTELLSRFNGLEEMTPKAVSSVTTVDLDYFTGINNLLPVDFIKIDVQGAELEIFKGGLATLRGVKVILSEVEFVPMYIGQPLFGDLCTFLTQHGFMFHKFTGLAGRSMAPLMLNNDIYFATQHLWADAIFCRNVTSLESLTDEMLLKMGVLLFLYGSPDVCYCCFGIVDQRNGSNLAEQLLGILNPAHG